MPYTDGGFSNPVGPSEDQVEELFLRVFQIPPARISAQARQWHHIGQLTVDKHRDFNCMLYMCPQRSLLQECLHLFCMFLRDSLVVVVNEKTVV